MIVAGALPLALIYWNSEYATEIAALMAYALVITAFVGLMHLDTMYGREVERLKNRVENLEKSQGEE